jgi:hypothetical protein
VPGAGAAARADEQLVGAFGLDQLLDDGIHGGAAPIDQALSADLQNADVGEDPVVGEGVGGLGEGGVVQRPAVDQRGEIGHGGSPGPGRGAGEAIRAAPAR